MSVNDNTKPLFGFLNDARVANIESKLSSDFVANADLDAKVGNNNFIKIGAVNEALGSYYTKNEADAKYAVPADIPSISGLQNASDVSCAISTAIAGKQDKSTLGDDVANEGFQRSSGVLLVVSNAGYVRANDVAITNKLVKTNLDSEIVALNKYATKSEVASDLQAKVSINSLQSAVDNLNRYALGSDMATALDAKTSKTYVDDALALKQNVSDMSAYALGVDMSSALDAKASASRVNAIKSALETLLTTLISGSDGDLATAYSTCKTSIQAS